MVADADLWQRDTINALAAGLKQDAAVKALALIGSCADPDLELDPWSDVDVVLVVEDHAFARFYPATDWLAAFGEIYAWDLPDGGAANVIRAWFTDGRRIDVIVIRESALAAME
jgi:predicted nucleotidyltransferase